MPACRPIGALVFLSLFLAGCVGPNQRPAESAPSASPIGLQNARYTCDDGRTFTVLSQDDRVAKVVTIDLEWLRLGPGIEYLDSGDALYVAGSRVLRSRGGVVTWSDDGEITTTICQIDE